GFVSVPDNDKKALRQPVKPKDFTDSPFKMTDQIKEAFDRGLNILKPTKKQLEHGLALHRNAVVIDTYGFIPRAAHDGAIVNAAISDRASQLELQDMEEEMSMTRYVISQREREELENAFKASGVTCVIQNAGEEGND